MAGHRVPNERQLSTLQAVAEAGGASERVDDSEAAEEGLTWGWLLPHGAEGFRLSPEGWDALKAAAPEPVPPEAVEGRAHPRRSVMRPGAVIHESTRRTVTCTIIDISLGGARLQLFAPDLPKEGLTLLDREAGALHQLRVAWSLGPLMGVAFLNTVELPQP